MDERYLPLIEAMLARAVAEEGISAALRSSMEYSLLGGGKRLRPCICLACCEMLGGSVDAALPLACGVEMIHAYSLVHDDLPCMDDDDFRRGKPASHKVYGEAGAVLAGDALLTHAFTWMLAHAPEDVLKLSGYVEAVRTIADGAGARGMVGGQSLELSGALENGSARLEEVHRFKTGALIRAAACAGALAAGAADEAFRAVEAFSSHYGALFQLADDILDADEEKGSPKNYAAVYGIGKAHEAAKAHADAAREALRPFGEKAAYLLRLTDEALMRAQ